MKIVIKTCKLLIHDSNLTISTTRIDYFFPRYFNKKRDQVHFHRNTFMVYYRLSSAVLSTGM